ncbi:uncharacterized protein LOC118732340 [Rhagoletis pomonella]|uniref:uncharacterized protein LOC118732340 n=1 Tax=Rhagoletis pomonella TaxID=28610 RepID=UPI001785F2D1|nr:uncharacterized protein LOC118732340 [Rhagoletis pomonella]
MAVLPNIIAQATETSRSGPHGGESIVSNISRLLSPHHTVLRFGIEFEQMNSCEPALSPLLLKFGCSVFVSPALLRICQSDAKLSSATVELVQIGAATMSNVHPFCVYCSKKSGKLHLFDAAKLNKCLSILKIRKDGDLTFSNVVLPEQPNNFQRYHSQCHNRFTALPPKQRGYDPKKQASSSSSTDKYLGTCSSSGSNGITSD